MFRIAALAAGSLAALGLAGSAAAAPANMPFAETQAANPGVTAVQYYRDYRYGRNYSGYRYSYRYPSYSYYRYSYPRYSIYVSPGYGYYDYYGYGTYPAPGYYGDYYGPGYYNNYDYEDPAYVR